MKNAIMEKKNYFGGYAFFGVNISSFVFATALSTSPV
jgi:hypothetical protein